MDPDDGRVVTNFIKQVLHNKDLTVYGDGLQTRSFCYVDDLISGITRLGMLDPAFAPDHPINLGNPTEFTVMDLALEVLRQVPESTSKIEFAELPVHDPMQRRPDITIASNVLGWQPQIDLATGLSRLIPYMRAQFKK
jgi:UDP-glucuronate decarboxylase